MDQLIGFICEKNLKMDPKPIEAKFKTEVPILQADEVIELAFMCGRDMFLFTNKRTIDVDVQGDIFQINIFFYQNILLSYW